MAKNIFATDKDETVLYVQIKAIMSPIIALMGEIPITVFGKGKTMYAKVDDAIEWCNKEKNFHSKKKYETMIAVVEKAKRQLEQERTSSKRPALTLIELLCVIAIIAILTGLLL